MELKPGTTFANRYLLIDRIGFGGYSQVWLAEDQMTENMQVAVKIFESEQGLDDKSIKIFREEYKITFNLMHAHILKPQNFDISNGRPFLVMQYCKGGNLFSLPEKPDEREIAKIIKQIAGALKYLHEQSPPLIHRDIKPENILYDGIGMYYLSDFGITSKMRRTLTQTIGDRSKSAGTTAFMAPEKFAAQKQTLPASDIFSFGVLLHELITGELPFGKFGGMVLNQGAETPIITGQCSKELATIVSSCLAKKPEKRPTAGKLENLAGQYLKTGKWGSLSKSVPKAVWMIWAVIFILIGYQAFFSGNKNPNGTTVNVPEVPTSGTIHDDRDGQTYPWITIGDQVWMAQNMGYKPWQGNYWVYDNNLSNLHPHGVLYEWETAHQICPPGWLLPTDRDWQILEGFIDSHFNIADPVWKTEGWRGTDVAKKLKSQSGWHGEGNGIDEFGFNALPSGARYRNGMFDNKNSYGYFWVADEFDANHAWRRVLGFDFSKSGRTHSHKRNAFSVRCIKEEKQNHNSH